MKEQVLNSLRAAIINREFDQKVFFRSWFRDQGQSYFFLFTKNLKVTNLQVAELHALLRTYISEKDSRARVRDFQLLSVQEFNDSVRSLVQSFAELGLDRAVVLVSELYTSLLKDIVCIQLYFGSCAVFLPSSMRIHLLPICAEAGYIHSCGPSVLNRNVAKATKVEFFDRLRAHLDHRGIAKARLVVYAHEDFTRYDRKLAQELKDGLDDVKIHAEKYYVGKDSLVQILKDLRSDVNLGSKLELAEPSHYAKGDRIGDMPVIWLLVDRRPKIDVRTRSDEQYYILYEQEFRKESAFHLFDENKPAWIDHTTIPHTLTGAMINITRPWWPERRLVITDPFVGTGTTWFEALKYQMDKKGVDKEVLVEQMVSDNLDFFCLTPEALFRLNAAIWLTTKMRTTRTEALEKRSSRKYESLFSRDDFWREVEKDVDWARELFKTACTDQHKHDVTVDPEALKLLREAKLLRRVLFYLALRAHRRNLAAIERETVLWTEAYRTEALQLAEQMEELQELLLRRQAERIMKYKETEYAVFDGRYSQSCDMPLARLREAKLGEAAKTVRCAAAEYCPELDPYSCDLIVTDPPYGLNAEYDPYKLAKLFQKILERMVWALRDGGQLVLALPDWSHIGKQVPFFATRQFVTQAILAAAERQGGEVVLTAHSVPNPREAFRAPYYWESDRALRRAIIHFRFRKSYPASMEHD